METGLCVSSLDSTTVCQLSISLPCLVQHICSSLLGWLIRAMDTRHLTGQKAQRLSDGAESAECDRRGWRVPQDSRAWVFPNFTFFAPWDYKDLSDRILVHGFSGFVWNSYFIFETESHVVQATPRFLCSWGWLSSYAPPALPSQVTELQARIPLLTLALPEFLIFLLLRNKERTFNFLSGFWS